MALGNDCTVCDHTHSNLSSKIVKIIYTMICITIRISESLPGPIQKFVPCKAKQFYFNINYKDRIGPIKNNPLDLLSFNIYKCI